MWASAVVPLLLATVLLLQRSAEVQAASKHACEGEVLRIACYPNTVAYVRSAMFGKSKGTPKPPYRCGDRTTLYRDCQREMTHYFRHHCHAKNKCDVTIDSGAFGGAEFCVDVLKFAEVVYDCVPMTTITAVESCQDKCLPPPSVIQFLINKYAPAPAPGKPGAASPAAATRPGAPPVLPLRPSPPGQGNLPPPPPQLRTQLRSPTSAVRTPGVINRNPNTPSSGPPNNNRGFNNAGPPPRPSTLSNVPNNRRPPSPPNLPMRRGPPTPPTHRHHPPSPPRQQRPGFVAPPIASLPYGNSRFAAALSRFTPTNQGVSSFLRPQAIAGRSSSSSSSSSSSRSSSNAGGSPTAASAPSSSSNVNAGFSFPQTNARPRPHIPARHAALTNYRNAATAGRRPPPQSPAPAQPAGLQLNHSRQPSPSGGSGGAAAAISRTDKLSLLSRMQGLLAELRAKKEAAAAKAAAAEAAAV